MSKYETVVPVAAEVVSAEKEQRLAALCKAVHEFHDAYQKACVAIYQIDKEKLYAPFGSITEFCSERWGYHKTTTSRYKNEGEFLTLIADFDIKPTCEGQCRVVVEKLNTHEWVDFWKWFIKRLKKQNKSATSLSGKFIEQAIEAFLELQKKKKGIPSGDTPDAQGETTSPSDSEGPVPAPEGDSPAGMATDSKKSIITISVSQPHPALTKLYGDPNNNSYTLKSGKDVVTLCIEASRFFEKYRDTLSLKSFSVDLRD